MEDGIYMDSSKSNSTTVFLKSQQKVRDLMSLVKKRLLLGKEIAERSCLCEQIVCPAICYN
ncbi:hypothetical protein J6590_008245 [Homalodisca vitripennis]|nr:hypothetical protein J6590_008245 [Homalodisca vitripennis]